MPRQTLENSISDKKNIQNVENIESYHVDLEKKSFREKRV